jgi:hypothetical protein
MEISSLANELLIDIVEYLDRQRDINSVCLVNRRCHHLFNDYLYRYNIQFRKGNALLWAAEHDCQPTMRRLLHLGANVNEREEKESTRPLHTFRWGASTGASNTHKRFGVTALHIAAAKGHIASVKLLLELGANPQAAGQCSWTPLYVALATGHEKVARTISRRIDRFTFCLAYPQRKLTPLHVASRCALPASVRYFLDRGARIEARDENGETPLYHALKGYFFGELGPSLDLVFETVELLLKSGANPDLEIPDEYPRSRPTMPTPRKLGIHHQCERVRALFAFPLRKTMQVGRTWMHEDEEGCIRGQSILESLKPRQVEQICTYIPFHQWLIICSFTRSQPTVHVQQQPDTSNINDFPTLNNTCQSSLSLVEQHLSLGRWSTSNTDQLVAGFHTPLEPDEDSDAESPKAVEQFPALTEIETTNLQDEASINLWAKFEKEKSVSIGEGLSENSPDDKEKQAAGSKRAKKHGKGRWQPLKL